MKKPTWCRFFFWWVSSATSLRCGNCSVVTLHPRQPRPFGVRPQFLQRFYQNKKPTTRVSFGMWELLDCRVASATTSSLRDLLRRPARAVLAGGLARPYIRLQANAVKGYKQHAGAVCLTPSCQILCMGFGVRRLAAVRLEFPAHPTRPQVLYGADCSWFRVGSGREVPLVYLCCHARPSSRQMPRR